MKNLTAIPGCTGEVCTKTQKPGVPQGIETSEGIKKRSRQARSSRRRRILILITGTLLTLFVSQALSVRTGHSYYLNLSSSVPLGLYKIIPQGKIMTGDLVVFDPPQGARSLIYNRHWLPYSWPLIKYVGAYIRYPGRLFHNQQQIRRGCI